VVRAETLQIKRHNYVEVAKGMGCGHTHLIRHHILPRLAPICLVIFTTRISRAMIIISSLSFLGFGLEPPAPDWGTMIREAVFHFRTAPHLILAPGLVIFGVTFSVNLIGDELRDYFHVG
jgi:ABC-type dipeptide/oligopeptide/nickel transport system permease subunit